MMQSILQILIVITTIIASICSFLALPIKPKATGNQKRIGRHLPLITIFVTFSSFFGLIYGYAEDNEIRNTVDSINKLPNQNSSKPYRSGIQFSAFQELRSTFSLSDPLAGISCSQVRRTENGSWDITGKIRIGGIIFTDIKGVNANFAKIGPYNLAELITLKCGQS